MLRLLRRGYQNNAENLKLIRAKTVAEIMKTLRNADPEVTSIPLGLRMIARQMSRKVNMIGRNNYDEFRVSPQILAKIDIENLNPEQLSDICFWLRKHKQIKSTPMRDDQYKQLYAQIEDTATRDAFTLRQLTSIYNDLAQLGPISDPIHNALCKFLDDEFENIDASMKFILQAQTGLTNYFPTRKIINSTLKALNRLEMDHLEQFDLVVIYECLLSLNQRIPKAMIGTQIKRFANHFNEMSDRIQVPIAVKLLRIRLDWPYSVSQDVCDVLMETIVSQLQDGEGGPITLLNSMELISEYYRRGWLKDNDRVNGIILNAIKSTLTNEFTNRPLLTVLKSLYYLDLQSLPEDLKTKIQDSLSLFSKKTFRNSLPIYIYSQIFYLNTDNIALNVDELKSLTFPNRTSILAEIDTLPLDVKAQSIQMVLLQSLVDDIKTYEDYQTTIKLIRYIQTADEFIRLSPRAKPIREALLAKMYEFRHQARSAKVYMTYAIPITYDVDESVYPDLSKLKSPEDLVQPIIRYKSEFVMLINFLERVPHLLNADVLFSSIKHIRDINHTDTGRYAALLERIADPQNFRRATFSDYWHKLSNIVTRHGGKCPKFIGALAKAVESEKWLYTGMRIQMINSIAPYTKFELNIVKNVYDEWVAKMGSHNERAQTLLKNYPEIRKQEQQ